MTTPTLWCPQCGPLSDDCECPAAHECTSPIDEDGCCTQCGADTCTWDELVERLRGAGYEVLAAGRHGVQRDAATANVSAHETAPGGHAGFAPTWAPGDMVWYLPSLNGPRFPAVVDSEPWQLGGGSWVVRLRDLPQAYCDHTCRQRRTVPAAECTLHVIRREPGEGA